MLNQALYNRLRSCMPGGKVKVLNEGSLASLMPVTGRKDIKYRYVGGEEYACNCPFCNDVGCHLYINYRYGMEEVESKRRNFAVAHCFHGCLEKRENREELYNRIFAFSAGKIVNSSLVSLGTASVDRPINPPGKLIPVCTLPDNHPALVYLLKDRHFTKTLLKKYGVCYCLESIMHPMAVGKIIIPIWFKGEYVGWQARRIGDGVGPKYYTAPGFKKSRDLYNYDAAVKQGYVVLCEGVTDVWRVGSAGVCLFGKTASEEQKGLLRESWGNKPLVILLDPDARESADKLKAILDQDFPIVSILSLPEGVKDAAELSATDLKSLIERSLYENGA